MKPESGRQSARPAASDPNDGAEGRLRAALEVHRQIDLEMLLEALEAALSERLGAERSLIFSLADGGGKLVARAARGRDGAVPVDRRKPLPVGAVIDRFRAGRVVDVPDFGELADSMWPDGDADGEACVACEVRGQVGGLAGVIVLERPRRFDGRERADAARLLEEIGTAVDNAVAVRRMRELIIKDDTAACFNRRHFEEFLPEELSRAARFRSALSLIFFDLDNLKQVNSRHGHSMGSRTLFEVSDRVRGKIRRFDKLFRFGGDEFCIVLPGTEWHGALEVAERVREAIAGSRFLSEHLPEQGGIEVTASFGIASYPLHARTRQEIVQQADRAMQRIKRGTKNSIAIAEIVGNAHEDGT